MAEGLFYRLGFFDRDRLSTGEKWNFVWINRYGFGFRLWLLEVQVFFYRRGGWDG